MQMDNAWQNLEAIKKLTYILDWMKNGLYDFPSEMCRAVEQLYGYEKNVLSSRLRSFVPRLSSNRLELHFFLSMPKWWLVQLKLCITQTEILHIWEEKGANSKFMPLAMLLQYCKTVAMCLLQLHSCSTTCNQSAKLDTCFYLGWEMLRTVV